MMPLSIAPPIQADETLTSWIIRLSAANHYPIRTILFHLGLTDSERWQAIKGGHDIMLTPTEIDSIKNVTGNDVASHTITSCYQHAGFLTPLIDRSDLRAWAISNPVWVSKTMHCPFCLADNQAWKLEWKLPFHFLCLEHGKFLVSVCPECGWGSPEHYRDGNTRMFNASQVAAPGCCPAPRKPGTASIGRYATPCRHNLTKDPTNTASKRLQATQQAVLDEFDAGHDWGWWKDLQTLTGIITNYLPVTLVRKLHPGRPLPKRLLDHWVAHLENVYARYDAGLKRTNISYPYDPELNATAIPIALAALTDDDVLKTLTDLPRLHPKQTPPKTRISTAKPSPQLNARLPWRRILLGSTPRP